ncbi:hydantoinase/oxoprolinase family protein [Methylobacterium sp. J-030]|uniref:hydantoinase/oxoprolinase family protein n=1 Tax=Methylobacterium sp. J-030 TaxID=2836627 RepID=UPI001FBB033E|nr:hydantoinase/oxoprolinase family protein [Methylobacterium sp. J-030]MCJ2073365.1 hydantoinase/oxoprolinase family protein [Methylobacterium sp. J-030]
MSRLRVGVDIGGTFTDFAILDEETGRIRALKYPSNRTRPASSVLGGLQAALVAQGATAEEIIYFSHGTTLAVNTILEYNGARTALLVTQGFRDILYIGRHRLPDVFNFFTAMPAPLVRRAHVVEIAERTLADGSVALPVDRAAIAAAVESLRAFGVEAVAVGFLHSYRNGANEREAARLLAELAPDLYVSLSSEIWPQMREYERTLIGVMNAYVGRRMETYFGDLQTSLADSLGVRATLLSTKSNGGVMTASEAARRPTETLMSGPAAGAIGAAFVAKAAGFSKIVTLDMGGTSTDVSIIEDEPRYSTENHVGNFPVIMPAVDVTSIGAGGGSVAWIDDFGVLKVGPRSAGARPGPACYGHGGTEATLTDAFVCLGIVQPGELADGRVTIDKSLADAAVGALAEGLGRQPEAVAEDILRIATSHIYSALVPLLARKGVDYADYVLLPFGGAGPMHGLLAARDIGFRKVLVPANPGVLCATGALVADVRRDLVRTLHIQIRDESRDEVVNASRAAFEALEREGGAWLEAQNLAYTRHRFHRIIEMRYHGQSFEISVPVAPGDLDGDDSRLAAAFRKEYAVIYGQADRGFPIEVRDVRSVAIGETPKPALETLSAAASDFDLSAATVERDIFHDGRGQTARFIPRAAIGLGQNIAGPAVITQYDTTTFVPSGYTARVDRFGNLIAEADDGAR